MADIALTCHSASKEVLAIRYAVRHLFVKADRPLSDAELSKDRDAIEYLASLTPGTSKTASQPNTIPDGISAPPNASKGPSGGQPRRQGNSAVGCLLLKAVFATCLYS